MLFKEENYTFWKRLTSTEPKYYTLIYDMGYFPQETTIIKNYNSIILI